MISVAAYLENEKVADLKSEYVNGHCIPLVGASRLHDRLCERLSWLLRGLLAGSPCRLHRPPVKVRIREADDERFYYPDFQVACSEPGPPPDYLEGPRLIFEVLSAAGERRGREEKAPAYRRIPSLEELVLIGYQSPKVEVWRRLLSGGGDWVAETLTGTDSLGLCSVGSQIPLAWIYDGLPLNGR
jgi:Uma2 family endonuclease